MFHRRYGVLAAACAAAFISAAPASAANYTCEASALRGQVLTAPAIEPVTANKGAAACRADDNGLSTALAPLATASAVVANTALAGDPNDVRTQTATASGGVADLRIGPATSLGVQLPVDQALAGIPAVTVPGVGTLDLRAAILAALQPSPEVLRIQIAAAHARARCVSGRVSLEGTSQVAGIKLLGLELPTDKAVTQVAQAIGGGTIDPSTLDISQLLPGVNLNPLQQSLVQTTLNTLPDIPIPATLAEIRITPGAQEKTATRLTQRALHVNLKVGGRQILDLTLGEATVGANDVDCQGATAPPTSAAEAALQCSNRRLVLIDVLERNGRVLLVGAADRRYIGRTVDIHFVDGMRGGGPRVARAKVRSDGSFRTTAKLPPRSIRRTNRARYQARLGSQRSLRLKLHRRMQVASLRMERRQVRIAGRVTRPLARPIRTIEVKRRVSCDKWEVVKRIRPKRDGSFVTRVQAPPTGLAGTYRLETRVRKTVRNPKTYPTFTLPNHVDPR